MSLPERYAYWFAFTSLYLFWGSTYFAMRVMLLDGVPPFSWAAVRFLIAGAVPYLIMRIRGERAPTWGEWRDAGLAGLGLFAGGNGIVMWVEQEVPSSLTALAIGSAPVWFAVCDWLRPGGMRPTRRSLAGIAVGLLGLALLVDVGDELSEGVNPGPLLLLVLACISWVVGSLFSRQRPKHPAAWMAPAQGMLCGGVALLLLGLSRGELAALRVPSAPALGALAYLIAFGSWVGFGCYAWLLPRVSSAELSTYAYVNPVVAVALGVLFLSEPFGLRVVLAMTIILLGVWIVRAGARAGS